jgi:hypothetical protein
MALSGLLDRFSKVKGKSTTMDAEIITSEASYQNSRNGRSRFNQILDGVTLSGRSHLRFTILVLGTMNLIFWVALLWMSYSYQKTYEKFVKEEIKVLIVDNGRTKIMSAVELEKEAGIYRNMATDEEIQALACDVVTLIAAADSQTVDASFDAVTRLMTPAMKYDFNIVQQQLREEIKRLDIYRKFENRQVRPMEEDDLPEGSNDQVSRYDMVVTGRLDTYRLGSNELIASGLVMYHVQLVPMERRTLNNPSALLVSSVNKFEKMQAPNTNSTTQR